jgi:hypothetical protein
MKKCPYCGKEYPDDTTVCPNDQHALVELRSTAAPPPIPPMPPRGPNAPVAPIAPPRRASTPLPTIAIIAIAVGVVGFFFLAVMAGLLLPALAKAKAKAVQINCASNLKQIGLAARIWAGDHNGQLPSTFMDLTNSLASPNIFICPADTLHPRTAAGMPAIWNPANVTYQFLTPGVSLDSVKGQVIVRCPIHGTELLSDGSVRFIRRPTAPNPSTQSQ